MKWEQYVNLLNPRNPNDFLQVEFQRMLARFAILLQRSALEGQAFRCTFLFKLLMGNSDSSKIAPKPRSIVDDVGPQGGMGTPGPLEFLNII